MTLVCPKCGKPCDAGSTKSSWSCSACGASGKNGFPGNDGMPAHQFTVMRYDDGRVRIKRPRLELWEQFKLTEIMLHDLADRTTHGIHDEVYSDGAFGIRKSSLFTMQGSINRALHALDGWKDMNAPMDVVEIEHDEEHAPDDPPKDGSPPKEDVPEWANATCADCNEPISVKVDEFSQKEYGRPLCWKHQRAEDKVRAEKEATK